MQIVGAQNSVFKFEDIRIKRDFNNSINRVMNCEIANEKKTIVASNQQIKDIKLIEKYMQKKDLDERLTNIMNLRKDHPDVSLRELSDLYEQTFKEPLSKSGLNHRLTKIRQLADQIRESRGLS
jgi:DNA-binding protein WhiA